MKKGSWISLTFILILICSSIGVSKDLTDAIDSYIRSRKLPTEFSGDVLIARQHEILFHKSYGMADYENDVPISTRTIFRIGSLTKPITAVAIMILQKQNRLNVNDPIDKYIPNIPEEWKKVKIVSLLTHTSGIPDLFGDLDEVPVENTSAEIDRVIRTTEHCSLDFEPGTKYAYTNFNYCLLGYICEKASGQSYASFLRTNIFEASEMNRTFYDDPRPIIKGRAQGYVSKNGKLFNDKLTDPAGYAAGGLLSTSEDLFHFNQALYLGKLLPLDVLTIMFTPVHENYGYGWQITRHFNRTVFCHRGGTHGFSSYMARFPEEDNLFIAVLSNVEEQSSRAVACDIAAMYFHAPQSNINLKTVRTGDFERLTGDYELSTGDKRTILLKSPDLYYKAENAEYKLLQVSADEFIFEAAEEIHLKFAEGVDGSIEMVRSSCGQEEVRGIKVRK